MRSSLIYRPIFALLAMTIGISASSQTAVQNRINSAVQESRRVSLAHTVAPRAALAADLGTAPSARKLDSLTMRFSMTDAQQAALSQLLIDQQNPASPRYHQWLTSEQFGAQFGLSAADIAKVSSWLTSQGFTITGTAKSSTFITFSGTVAQTNQAFGTTIHSLSLNGEQHIANLTEPTLPTAIAGVVQNITGMSDFRPRARLLKKPLSRISANPRFTEADGDHDVAPGDFYTVYDVNPLLTQSVNGAGIKIAVMGQVDLTANDVATFRSLSGLPANAPTTQTYGTDPGAVTASCLNSGSTANCFPSADDLDESLLDVEWAGATAPGASIIFVNSQDVIGISLVNAIDNNLAPIMTVSYGNCESAYPANEIASLNLTFQEANAKGITIFGPAGDDGATDCELSGETAATGGLAVDFPASSPYVTGVGGTTFSGDTGSAASSFWNATNGTNSGSAIKYIPESAWNETALDLTGTSPSFGAGGGGASIVFAKPAWQVAPGVPNDSARDVPDVSLNAAANHDGYIVCVPLNSTTDSCQNGTYLAPFQTSTGVQSFPTVFGGTSAATPSFAGILALVEQKLGGGKLGNINPTLYALAAGTNYNSIFHDVTSGNNDSPCLAGTQNCPNGGQIGFTASTGYDQATGLGSVDVSVLANDWKSVTPAVSGTLLPALTTVTTTTALPVTAGTAVVLSVKVASGATTTTTPTGTVQLVIDGTATGSAVALSSGIATLNLSTTSLSSGTHVIGASYSGDGTYGTSVGTINVDVTSVSAPDFTLTPSNATITVAGGSVSSGTTFTVTAKNGFTGTVIFSSTGGISGQDTFSVNNVSITLNSTTTSGTFSYQVEPSVGDIRSGQLRSKLSPNRLPSIHQPSNALPSRAPWYVAGSGSILACLLLVTVPRRRRWGALLVAIISVAAIGAGGCGGSSSTTTATAPTAPTSPTSPTTPTATSDTYTVLISATGTTSGGTVIRHSATVTVVVPQ